MLKGANRQLLVWKTGTIQAGTFGAEVYGMNKNVIKWLRGAAARLCPGGGIGALRAAVLGIHSDADPARKAVLGPIVRYAEEIWEISDPGLWHSRLPSPQGNCIKEWKE